MEKDFNNLGSDNIRSIAIELSPPDLVNFCNTTKSLNHAVCDSRDFWYRKLIKDYPYYRKISTLKNPKNTYLRNTREVFLTIEKEVYYPESNNFKNTERIPWNTIVLNYYNAFLDFLKSQEDYSWDLTHLISISKTLSEKYNLHSYKLNHIIISLAKIYNVKTYPEIKLP